MAIQTIKATIQMRNGIEEKFDPDQMTAGEWAASTDSKKVWMCFRPGLVLRMATYEAFEQDMREIQFILATCRDIQEAVEEFVGLARQHEDLAEVYSVLSKSWAVGGTGMREGEDTDNAEYYRDQAKHYSELAENAVDVSKPNFTVDLNTGHLLYEGGRFEFEVENGHLLWGTTL